MNREIAGNFAKRRKIREFLFYYIYFEKKIAESYFVFFFKKKEQQTIFLTFNDVQNISPKLYFLGGGPNIYIKKKKLNLSLNLQVKFREFSKKEIWKNRESAGNLEMGNS